ncbi:MAG: ribonuclease III, partial [Bowdeniella nasicola]|nr:ribonuclease III [Bowdeniella nasicola]
MTNEATAHLFEQLQVEIDPELLVLALTHRSFAHEAGGIPTNERLEFLGDSVLGYVVTDYLYRSYPQRSEAELSTIRAGVVSQNSLSAIAREINLGPLLLLGKGEDHTGGRNRDSILCDTMEAVIGACYLSNGMEITRAMILRLVNKRLGAVVRGDYGVDWRTALERRVNALGLDAPVTEITGRGPDHAREYTAMVTIDT